MAATTLIKKENLEALVEARKKEAVEKIAPQVVSVTTTFGKRITTGYRYDSDGTVFDYNELTGVVIVSIGPNDQFAVNVETNKCTVYRNGSWLRVLDNAVKKLQNTEDTADLKHKILSRFRDVFGV